MVDSAVSIEEGRWGAWRQDTRETLIECAMEHTGTVPEHWPAQVPLPSHTGVMWPGYVTLSYALIKFDSINTGIVIRPWTLFSLIRIFLSKYTGCTTTRPNSHTPNLEMLSHLKMLMFIRRTVHFTVNKYTICDNLYSWNQKRETNSFLKKTFYE